MTDKILLGFEVGSGKPVYLPLHHLAIFGMTQKSGKTTTLEALISRSGLKAIAFIVKRGEAGFTKYNQVTPYYKPRADWQFVEGLVNVALGEKVKFEPGMRYAIMNVCRGRKDLKEIQLAARSMAKTDKSAFMRSVYEKLDEYLEIVIPELDKWTFTDHLELSEGINVMDLSGMRLETQHIVIASTIEYAFVNLDHIIVIIPEAWETIPQGKMTPVKWVAQQFIRKGAALGNYLWLDSQDIGGIDKTPLRQCDNWLMGRMKEAHEVERILKQLLGAKIPAEEIQTLPLGHFYAAIGNEVRKIYVLPLGVPEEIGVDVAKGIRTPESVRDEFIKVKVMESDEMYKEMFEEEKRKREECEKEFARQLEVLTEKARQEGFREAMKKVDEIKKEFKVDEYQQTIAEMKDRKASLETELKKLEPLKAFGAALQNFLIEIGAYTPATLETPVTSNVSTISIADIDERINQRLSSGPEPIPLVSVDVDQRIKELVKNEIVSRLVHKIQALPEPAKKAAWWLHEKRQANIKDVYNYVYDKQEVGGRIPGAFYMNVINPLVDTWLIVNESGVVRWILQEKFQAELKDVLGNSDIEKVPKYLASLLL